MKRSLPSASSLGTVWFFPVGVVSELLLLSELSLEGGILCWGRMRTGPRSVQGMYINWPGVNFIAIQSVV